MFFHTVSLGCSPGACDTVHFRNTQVLATGLPPDDIAADFCDVMYLVGQLCRLQLKRGLFSYLFISNQMYVRKFTCMRMFPAITLRIKSGTRC